MTRSRKIDYVWHLRRMMAERDMYSTTDLVPLLSNRGVELSREQVYRLVVQKPQRINVAALVALCDILDCGLDDLIEPVKRPVAKKTTVGSSRPDVRPRRAQILAKQQE